MSTTHDNTRPRFIRGVSMLAASAAGLALSVGALAQAPVPDAPTPPRVRVSVGQGAGSSGSGAGVSSQGRITSSYSLVMNDNGRTIKIEMKDNVVTHAEVDGETIPDDRIENTGEAIRLKDENGDVIYEVHLPGSDAGSWAGTFSLTDPGQWRRYFGQGATGLPGLSAYSLLAEPPTSVLEDDFEPPPVMLGVQLGSPDSTLAGHLGIDREKATLLAGVHEDLPADRAGLKPYDLIVGVEGGDDGSPKVVREALRAKKPGDTITFTVIQQGKRKDVTLTLEAYDRKKLSSAKAERIAADDNIFAVAVAPSAPGALPPLPPSIPEEYRKIVEEHLRAHGMGMTRAFSIGRTPRAAAGSNADQQKLLAEIERQQAEAARHAQELSRRLNERLRAPGAQPRDLDELNDRMQRLERMLERLIDEKEGEPNPNNHDVKESRTRA